MNIKKGIYRHFKGKLYNVLEVAKHSETMEEYVVYKALYGEEGIWVRPLDMFTETIVRDGQEIKRFELVQLEFSKAFLYVNKS